MTRKVYLFFITGVIITIAGCSSNFTDEGAFIIYKNFNKTVQDFEEDEKKFEENSEALKKVSKERKYVCYFYAVYNKERESVQIQDYTILYMDYNKFFTGHPMILNQMIEENIGDKKTRMIFGNDEKFNILTNIEKVKNLHDKKEAKVKQIRPIIVTFNKVLKTDDIKRMKYQFNIVNNNRTMESLKGMKEGIIHSLLWEITTKKNEE